ncbi:MAG: DUF1624 domain-containing protein [Candidatus Lokiarchaeota archaeon]|nr:DUF1624 domain-containing protein [Candidatus Lokiarchaeota archaeon]
MKRLKSLDIFRGLSMLWMFLGHLLDWWLLNNAQDRQLYSTAFSLFDVIGAGAFIFVSGMSTTISYRTRVLKSETQDFFSKRRVRNEYLLRASFILILALIYNIPIAIFTHNVYNIWIWYVLLTVAISLLLAWPFLKTTKHLRLATAMGMIFANHILIGLLSPYEGETSSLGVLFHLLYNGYPIMDPIFTFFPFFLMGTVIGDVIYEILLIESNELRKKKLREKLLLPCLGLGAFFMILGVIYDYPEFLNSVERSFSWVLYSLGFQLIFVSILIYIEESALLKTKKSFKFLYYFSYYSLSIFLLHNLLYFAFYQKLSASMALIFVFATVILVGFLLRFIYKKFGRNASLKSLISRLSVGVAKMIENKIYKKTLQKTLNAESLY